MEIKDLKPELLFKHFYGITQIPRPSGKEEAIRNHMISWAKGRGLETKTDAPGNLVIKVPATKGFENSETVVLQGHLDMVAEKNSDSKIDPNTDPLDVYIDGDWITARGTTLGADNGIALAAAMAIVDEKDSKHGPLEILATVDEETALVGAFKLESDMLKGRKLLNLDTEEIGAFYIGCAGGEDTVVKLNIDLEDAPKQISYKVLVFGLKGGHSGLDIRESRANANKVLTGTLKALKEKVNFSLSEISGGNKRNAIPREAVANIFIDSKDESKLKEVLSAQKELYAKEFSKTDPNLNINLEKLSSNPKKVMSRDSSNKVLDLIEATYDGVTVWSKDIKGFVETSTNLGVVQTKDNYVEIVNCKRSSVDKAMSELRDKIRKTSEKFGAKVEETNGYPGWAPNMNSPLLKIGKDAWKEMYGKYPEVKAIHAGLECGIIGEKFDGMDMISIGPDIQGAHSPDEKLHIPSSKQFYEFLRFFIEKLA